jgi:CheY-like chemotaxis protein
VGEAIARVMERDAEVEIARDARSALERLAAGERWDAILCDLMMPEISGMDLYGEVLVRAPDAARAFLFMTAGAFTPRARAFVQTLGARCLAKPLDAEALREAVRTSRRSRATGP